MFIDDPLSSCSIICSSKHLSSQLLHARSDLLFFAGLCVRANFLHLTQLFKVADIHETAAIDLWQAASVSSSFCGTPTLTPKATHEDEDEDAAHSICCKNPCGGVGDSLGIYIHAAFYGSEWERSKTDWGYTIKYTFIYRNPNRFKNYFKDPTSWV